MTGEILPDYLRAVRPAECLGHAKFIKKPEKVTLRTKLRLHFFRVDRPASWAHGLFFTKNTRKLLYGRNPACKFTSGSPRLLGHPRAIFHENAENPRKLSYGPNPARKFTTILPAVCRRPRHPATHTVRAMRRSIFQNTRIFDKLNMSNMRFL